MSAPRRVSGASNFDPLARVHLDAPIAKTQSVKARDVCRRARDILGGNGITLDFHVMRHLCDMEALVTYEGTAEIQSLIVGKHITGQSAFA